MRRALLVVVLGAVVALLWPAQAALAHAYLTGSDPADGSSLAAAPHTISLRFSESVTIGATRIELVDGAGRHYRGTHLRIRAGGSAETPSVVTADLPPLPHGAFRLQWETLSSDDLHRTSGVLVFGVARVVHGTPFREAQPGTAEVAIRWVLFVGLAGALGSLLVLARRRVDALPSRVQRRLRAMAAGGALLALLASVVLLAEQVADSGQAWSAVVTGSYGARWAVRAAGLLGLVVTALVSRSVPRGAKVLATIASALATGAGSVLLSHSEALGADPTALVAGALHLIATSLWTGLLLVGVLVGVPRSPEDRAVAREVLRGFAMPAAASVTVLVVSGVYLSSDLVGSVDAALRTTYGRTLLLKLVLFGLAAVLGLVHVRRLHSVRASGGATPRRAVWAEAALVVGALACAAVLTSGQPAREPQFVSASVPHVVPLQDQRVADLQETVRVGPNHVGRAVVLVDVLSTRRPAPAPIAAVTIRIGDTDQAPTMAASRIEATNRWSAPVGFSSPGAVSLRVLVERPGLAPVAHTFRWVVAASPTLTRPELVSTAPIAGPLRRLAYGLGLLAVFAWAIAAWLIVRRRRALPGTPAAPAVARPVEPKRTLELASAGGPGDA